MPSHDMNIALTQFIFREYEVPKGWLPRFEEHPAAHGLFYYAMCAKKLLNTQYKEELLVYEDELWPEETRRPFEALFKNIMIIQYDTQLDQAVRYWPAVNLQLKLLHLDELPEDLMFRRTIEIKTSGSH